MENDPAQRNQSVLSLEERQRWTKELSKTKKFAAGLMIAGILSIGSGATDMTVHLSEQEARRNNETVIFQSQTDKLRTLADGLAIFGGIFLLALGYNGRLNTKLRREALDRGKDPSKVWPIML